MNSEGENRVKERGYAIKRVHFNTDIWIVKSVSGDRVVIDKNVNGTSAICSPVNMKYIRKK